MNADIERLVDQITQRLLLRLEEEADRTGSLATSQKPANVDVDTTHCSPHHLACALNAGAVRLGLPWGQAASVTVDIAQYIDHTLLKPEATRVEIEQLCDEARSYQFASVCVNPTWVREAAVRLLGSNVRVCTVVGFPLGATLPDVKAYETRRAIFDGATEIDMVINIGALKSGDDELVGRDIAAVVSSARDGCAIVKVILETALLTDEEKIRGSRLAREAGADFVKTSTGFSRGGATVADIELMRKTVGEELGVKASGGVKDLTAAREMIAAGATRIGASAGVRIVQEAAGRQPSVTSSSSAY
jgi:deoxyribose-phosphate aldolase